ncbi:MAG: hypothetical protein JWM71_1057 [Solirubrobacteraceae bacterium]|nr:hypothetical protein [Solirubrobacteraceae bacterium]
MSTAAVAVIVVAAIVVIAVLAALTSRWVQRRRLDARREDATALREQARDRQLNADRHIAQAEQEQRFAAQDIQRAVEIDPDVPDDTLPADR